tara:strand:- start:1098 stop:2093 length:996 start_codon:yes stop_codon:yes gene_type:complete
MKISTLFFTLLLSFIAFSQKNKARNTSPKASVYNRASQTTPRAQRSPISEPSRLTRQTRPHPSRPSNPSSLNRTPSYYGPPSIPQHSTKHPAPSSSVSSSNSNREPSVGNSSSSHTMSPSSNNSSSNVNYSSQSCGTNSRTGYFNSFGPIVGVSGTGFEYDRMARLTGGQYLNYTSSQVVQALQDVITQNASDSTDIVILVDISGSMKNNVKDIEKESHQIVQAIPYGCRLGGAVFKYSKSPKWFKYSDLNEDHYYALDLITENRKYNSSESHYDALLKAMNANSWKNKKRMVITITDEFIESGENYNSERTIVSVANSRNIELYTIKLND